MTSGGKSAFGSDGRITSKLRPSDEQIRTLRCACGHGPDHYMVSPDATYSMLGWFTVTFGITTTPKTLEFRCRQCGEALRRQARTDGGQAQ